MTSITIATLPRLTRDELARTIRAHPLTPSSDSKIAVVDVRDSDHIGGHILGSVHAPTPTLDYRIPELVRQLKDKDQVVFHCALSQQRGPSAALRYLRERERMFPATTELTPESGYGDGDQETSEGTVQGKKQQVYVLDGGFVQWQEKYGKDKSLTEGYVEDIWKFGY